MKFLHHAPWVVPISSPIITDGAVVVNLADAIAYNNHDVDDGFRAGLLTLSQLAEQPLFAEHYEDVQRKYPDLEDRRLIYEIIRRMINHVVTDLIDTTAANLAQASPASIDEVRALPRELVTLSDEVFDKHLELKRFLNQKLYRHENVISMTDQARHMIKSLFERYMSDPEQMPVEFCGRASDPGDSDTQARTVADYIAGMTDRFAISEFERLCEAVC